MAYDPRVLQKYFLFYISSLEYESPNCCQKINPPILQRSSYLTAYIPPVSKRSIGVLEKVDRVGYSTKYLVRHCNCAIQIVGSTYNFIYTGVRLHNLQPRLKLDLHGIQYGTSLGSLGLNSGFKVMSIASTRVMQWWDEKSNKAHWTTSDSFVWTAFWILPLANAYDLRSSVEVLQRKTPTQVWGFRWTGKQSNRSWGFGVWTRLLRVSPCCEGTRSDRYLAVTGEPYQAEIHMHEFIRRLHAIKAASEEPHTLKKASWGWGRRLRIFEVHLPSWKRLWLSHIQGTWIIPCGAVNPSSDCSESLHHANCLAACLTSVCLVFVPWSWSEHLAY